MPKTNWMGQINLSPNIVEVSDTVSIPANVVGVSIELISNQWASKVGSGSIEFGIEVSTDNGVTWSLLTSASGEIRPAGKGIYLPTLNYSRANPLSGLARAYVVSTVAIRIGIDGELIYQV